MKKQPATLKKVHTPIDLKEFTINFTDSEPGQFYMGKMPMDCMQKIFAFTESEARQLFKASFPMTKVNSVTQSEI